MNIDRLTLVVLLALGGPLLAGCQYIGISPLEPDRKPALATYLPHLGITIRQATHLERSGGTDDDPDYIRVPTPGQFWVDVWGRTDNALSRLPHPGDVLYGSYADGNGKLLANQATCDSGDRIFTGSYPAAGYNPDEFPIGEVVVDAPCGIDLDLSLRTLQGDTIPLDLKKAVLSPTIGDYKPESRYYIEGNRVRAR